ncbi:MAG: MTH938/NDUFAF3 family protein, partial [Casimicrobiaceae bacterium]
HPRLTRALAAAGVGIEVMDTAAACRTYNILAAEGRRVTAALLLDS